MTKQFLAQLGIVIEQDEVSEEEGQKLIQAKFNKLETDNNTNKGLVDKYSSEIANLKKEKQDKMTDEEKHQQEFDELKNKFADSQRQLALRDKIADLVELGYDRETATKYATDELDGKSTIQYQKDFKAQVEAKAKAEALKQGKTPRVDNDDTPPSKEDVIKGGYEAMQKLAKEKPEVYKEYFGENPNQ